MKVFEEVVTSDDLLFFSKRCLQPGFLHSPVEADLGTRIYSEFNSLSDCYHFNRI